MKRITAVLFLLLVVAVAPSSFACWRCDDIFQCYDPGGQGRTNCTYDPDNGGCHTSGVCQGFRPETTNVAAKYRVAAVRVVSPDAKQLPPARTVVASR